MEWERLKLAVGHADVLSQIAFHSSMAYWQTSELVSKEWTVHRSQGGIEPITTIGDRATILVEGGCLADIFAADASPIHILGDVESLVSLKGQCEIVVGGSLLPRARLETEGIVRVFIGDDMRGTIVSKGSATLWINGNCPGEIVTGHPVTHLHIRGDFTGTIRPFGKASLLYLTVYGFVSNSLLEQIASVGYTQFNASIGASDKAPGIYPPHEMCRALQKKRSHVRWVVHEQRAWLPPHAGVSTL